MGHEYCQHPYTYTHLNIHTACVHCVYVYIYYIVYSDMIGRALALEMIRQLATEPSLLAMRADPPCWRGERRRKRRGEVKKAHWDCCSREDPSGRWLSAAPSLRCTSVVT